MNVHNPTPLSNVSQGGVQPQVHPPQGPNPTIPEPPPLPPNPTAFQKKETPGLIDVSQEGELTRELIQDSDPETLLQNTEKMPSLQSLLSGGVPLKHVETVERTGLESAQQEYRDHKKDLRVLGQTEGTRGDGLVRQTEDSDFSLLNTDALKTEIRQFSRELNQEQGVLETSLQDQFSRSLRDLSKTDKLLFKDQRRVQVAQVLEETQQHAKAWIEGLGSDHNTAILLKMMPEAELKMYVAKMVGDLKGYSDEERQNLSEKKEAFIAAIVSGIKEGLKSAEPSGNPGTLAGRLETMQTQIRQTIQGSPNLQQELPLMTRNQMREVLTTTLGGQPEMILESLLKGVETSSPNVVSREQVELPTKDGRAKAPQTFTLNGRTYAEPKFLGEGGFANVFRYKEVGTDNYVAVKISKPGRPEDRDQERSLALSEIRAHREILGQDGHENVIGFEGALRSDTDQLLIVQEIAPGGDLRQGVKTLDGAMESGALSVEHRQLLALHLLKGVLEGSRHMESQDGFHFDLKLDNFMIGGDMQSKMIDFGLSGLGEGRVYGAKTEIAQNPIFKSPERSDGEQEQVNRAQQMIDQHIEQQHGIVKPGPAPKVPVQPKVPVEPPVPVAPEAPQEPQRPSQQALQDPHVANLYMSQLSEYTERLLPKYQEDQAKFETARDAYPELKQKYDQNVLDYPAKLQDYNQKMEIYRPLKAQHDQLKARFKEQHKEYEQLVEKYSKEGMGEGMITAKSDNWAVGMMAYEMLVGNLGDGNAMSATHEIWQQTFLSEISRGLTEFGQGEGSILPKEGSSLGETPTVRLINSLMMPKGEDRVSFEGALQSSLFQDPRLGSPVLTEALELLTANPFPKKPTPLSEDEQANPDKVNQHQQMMTQYNLESQQWKEQFQPQLDQIMARLPQG